MRTRYKLRVSLNIEREESDDDREYWRPTQERLTVNEELDLGGLDFIGITGVLATLHDAVIALRVTPTGE